MSSDVQSDPDLDLADLPDTARFALIRKEARNARAEAKKAHDKIDRILWAVLAGALSMMATVVGATWVLSERMAAIEEVARRVERVEARQDVIEDRLWNREKTL